MTLSPFLKQSGQQWKFVVGSTVVALGLLMIFTLLGTRRGMLPDGIAAALFMGANVSNLCAAVWMTRAIRCPECKAKLLWHAVRSQAHPQGLNWFFTFTACPHCGFEPARAKPSAERTGDGAPCK